MSRCFQLATGNGHEANCLGQCYSKTLIRMSSRFPCANLALRWRIMSNFASTETFLNFKDVAEGHAEHLPGKISNISLQGKDSRASRYFQYLNLPDGIHARTRRLSSSWHHHIYLCAVNRFHAACRRGSLAGEQCSSHPLLLLLLLRLLFRNVLLLTSRSRRDLHLPVTMHPYRTAQKFAAT